MNPWATTAIVSVVKVAHTNRICNCSPSALLKWVISEEIVAGDLAIALPLPLTYNLQHAAPTR